MNRILVCGIFSIFLNLYGIHSTFTILSFNDVYEIVADQNGRGGFAEMMTILEDERQRSKYHITTVNGDFLSPCILSVFDKGAHRIELFNKMGVDLVSVGNHEFDFGPDEVLKRVQESQFPWFAANAIGLDGAPFTGMEQSRIIDVDGIKVGIFGLITTETPELSSTEKKVCFSPLVYTARSMIDKLRKEGADVIVALTHLLMEEDKKLAEEVPEIAVILGGHDHEPMTWYNDQTLVHKSGQNAYYLARVDLSLEKDDSTGRTKVFPSWNIILNKNKSREPKIAAIVDRFQEILQHITEEPIAVMGMSCDSLYSNVRAKEVAIGNLIADALRVSCEADVAIISGGIIRGNRFYEPDQVLSLRDLLVELPFGNLNVMIEVSGRTILAALENGVSQVEGKAGRFPQVSGMQFAYDADQKPGERIQDVFIAGEPLILDKLYKVATVNYMLHGGDGYDMFKEGKILISPLKAISLVDTVAHYVKEMGRVEVPLEGRIVIKQSSKRLDDVSFLR